jgi:EAL domain-containing protein (putative c-di-GMP-specific phosphodiesterase class I)/FixJ family two-component response regulator
VRVQGGARSLRIRTCVRRDALGQSSGIDGIALIVQNDVDDSIRRECQLEQHLRDALDNEELELEFQPQVEVLTDGDIVGFEALLRWRHPLKGLVSPAEFVPIAEQSGLIVAIGRWVLREACRRCAAWNAAAGRPIRVAVNVSGHQFGPALVQSVAAALAESGLDPRLLELELTESVLMRDTDQAQSMLSQLKSIGVALAIDDFGTGYCGLSYLRRFPIDRLKIDRSFVKDVTTNTDDAAICSTIIAMAHGLRLEVVAEGVETAAQLGFLLQRRCQMVQGYLFSAPLPAADAEALLKSGSRLELRDRANGTPARRLLLLDDEQNILSSLRRLFRRDGYEIHTATDAAQAFELLAANEIGVVISDQRMPGISGTEFLRRVKDIYPNTMRIVLSGYTELASVTEAINEGAIYRFVAKPWDDHQLRTAIREAFRHQEMASENARLDRESREVSAQLTRANAQLNALLDERAQRIERDVTVLGVAQEAVDLVPLPMLGADPDGMIALLNRAARELLPSARVGLDAAVCLPSELAVCLYGDAAALPDAVVLAGRGWRPQRHAMGARSASTGWLLILTGTESGAQSGVQGGVA